MMFQELSEEKRMQIKQNTVLSQAVQLITQEYPEKFAGEDGSQIKASIQGDIIWITGEMIIAFNFLALNKEGEIERLMIDQDNYGNFIKERSHLAGFVQDFFPKVSGDKIN